MQSHRAKKIAGFVVLEICLQLAASGLILGTIWCQMSLIRASAEALSNSHIPTVRAYL